MTIPVYRHNLDHDDWEVASVYDSDDSDSMGRSAYNESMHYSESLDEPAVQVQGPLHDETRFRFGYPVPQQQPPEQHQNYRAGTPRPPWDARYAPGKQSNIAPAPAPIVPPPGVIFPPKDWAHPPQDPYWLSTPYPIASSTDRPMNVGLLESPPPLLLSPSSPPRAPSPLIRRPTSPTTPTGHGPPPHGTSIIVPGSAGTGANVDSHASPIMPPPPRYHEVAHVISPRLAEAGCHAGMTMNSPRRSGHDVLLPYGAGPGHASMPRRPPSSEEFAAMDGHYGGGGGGGFGGHPTYGLADRSDLHAPPVSSKYAHEHEYEYDGGRARTARPQRRERRPSIWQRFVRRFSPSRASVG